MNGLCNSKKLATSPGAVGRGKKVKYHYISITKSFQRLVYLTLCVPLQIEDMKHIKRDFCSDAWVMPQRWDLGARGAKGVFFSIMVM